MQRSFAHPILMAILSAGTILAGADRTSAVALKKPAVLQGTLAAGKEETWMVTLKDGKEARLSIQKGRGEVGVDIYDPQNLTANEGVAEQDWFPVAPGRYKITVTNVTGLGKKSGGQSVGYALKFEVK